MHAQVAVVVGCGLLIVAWAVHAWQQSDPGRPLHLGQRHPDTLHASDPIRAVTPRGPERRWAFEGRAGQSVIIAADSYEFNTSLLLFDPRGQQIAWSDDNGGFFNARMSARLPVNGRYTVIVCGANADHFGTYWLSLEEGAQVDQVRHWSEPEVLAYYQRGMAWAEGEKNQRAVSWLNVALGEYFRERRQWKRAEEHYGKSQAAAEASGFLYGQWAVALERGRLLARRMRFDQAIGELQRALALSQKLRAVDDAEALVHIQLGDLYLYMERADLAKVHYKKATQQAERSRLSSILVRLYTSLSGFVQQQDKEKAIEYAQKAYRLHEGADSALNVRATQTLAATYLFLISDRSEEGFKLATEARNAAHRLGCVDDEVSILTMMSMGHYKSNNIEEMIRFAREAVELTSPDDEDPNPRRVALQTQAHGEFLRGIYEAALQLCLQALQTLEDAWERESVEELRQNFLAQSKTICTQIIMNLYALNARHPSGEYARQAFDYAERSRSRSLLDQLVGEQTETTSTVNPQLLYQDRHLLEKISTVGRQLVLFRAEGSINPVSVSHLLEQRAKLVAERIQLQTEIRRSTRNSYRAVQLSPLTAEQIQKGFLAAHPNSAILYYQLGIQEGFLIVLTRSQVFLFKLPDWSIIRKAVGEWWAQINQQLNVAQPTTQDLYDYAQVAYRLYNLLIKPAAHLIRGRDLIIAPSDALYDLAFEALVVKEPDSEATFKRPHYLVEDYAITYAPSVSVLAELENERERAKPGKEILLVGDPVFNERDPRVAQTEQSRTNEPVMLAMNQQRFRSGLNRLPATRQEVLAIAGLAKQFRLNPTIWLGFEANEENFKSSTVASPRFVHLATHAVADYQDGDFSALILSLNQDKAGNDGILTTDEIARLRLNADLVVLSGCETGMGQRTIAEGVVGLSRAFIIAGARRVCGSLWKVEDTSTQKLMSAFYEGLLVKKLGTPEALRRAKLTLLRGGAAPSQWGPFILVGSPR
jgi:CHAT domain-containing protein